MTTAAGTDLISACLWCGSDMLGESPIAHARVHCPDPVVMSRDANYTRALEYYRQHEALYLAQNNTQMELV